MTDASNSNISVSRYLNEVRAGLKPLDLPKKLPLCQQLPSGELSDAIREIARAVSELPARSSVPPRALIVGGYVRDLVRGEMPLDADMQVYGVSPEDLECVTCQLFPDKVKRAGKSYEILIIRLTDSLQIDLSIPRESLTPANAPFEAGKPCISAREAAMQRDFSMNNLAMDPLSGEVFDWFGGVKDMSSGILRVTSAPHFIQRSIHPYRAAQFSSRFGFIPDIECYQQMSEIVKTSEFKYLHPLRVQAELNKLFSGRIPSLGLEVLRMSGVISSRHFELDRMITRGGDAFLLKTYKALDRAASVICSNSFCCSDDEKLATMYAILCHAFASEESVRAFLSDLKLSARLFASAVSLYVHQDKPELNLAFKKPPAASEKSRPRPAIFPFSARSAASAEKNSGLFSKIVDLIYPANWKMLLLFRASISSADSVTINEFFLRAEEQSRQLGPDWRAATLIDKRDLIKTLGLSSGAHLGFIIGEVEKKRFDLITKANALSFVSANLDGLLNCFNELVARGN